MNMTSKNIERRSYIDDLKQKFIENKITNASELQKRFLQRTNFNTLKEEKRNQRIRESGGSSFLSKVGNIFSPRRKSAKATSKPYSENIDNSYSLPKQNHNKYSNKSPYVSDLKKTFRERFYEDKKINHTENYQESNFPKTYAEDYPPYDRNTIKINKSRYNNPYYDPYYDAYPKDYNTSDTNRDYDKATSRRKRDREDRNDFFRFYDDILEELRISDHKDEQYDDRHFDKGRNSRSNEFDHSVSRKNRNHPPRSKNFSNTNYYR